MINLPMKKIILIFSTIVFTSCATIVNDANVPVSLSFSNGETGTCNLSNKRISIQASIPGTSQIRRSDDALRFDCKTKSGKQAFGSIPSEMEGAKLGASVVFFDLGITDAITDKHRTYPSSYVIPVR